jgi:hypothetical protein
LFFLAERATAQLAAGTLTMSISIGLLWLFVVNLGIVVGAGLYENRVVVPLWASAPPQSLQSPNSGLRFWAFATTGALTLLTLANLVAAWLTDSPARGWWLLAGLVVLVERISTFSYFIPTILRLQRDTVLPPDLVRANLTRWARLGYVRILLCFVGWIAAMRALLIVT